MCSRDIDVNTCNMPQIGTQILRTWSANIIGMAIPAVCAPERMCSPTQELCSLAIDDTSSVRARYTRGAAVCAPENVFCYYRMCSLAIGNTSSVRARYTRGALGRVLQGSDEVDLTRCAWRPAYMRAREGGGRGGDREGERGGGCGCGCVRVCQRETGWVHECVRVCARRPTIDFGDSQKSMI